MVRESYEWAGVAAIGCAAGTLAEIVLALILDGGRSILQPRPWELGQLLLFIVIDAATAVLGIYAALRFRRLLNHRYLFHSVDDLILVLICGGVATSLSGYGFRVLVMAQSALAPAALALSAMLCVGCGVLGIVFAMRLLQIDGDLQGYKKPLAYTCLAESLGFALFLTAVAGAVVGAVYNVLLALVFFRSGEEPEELEIV